MHDSLVCMFGRRRREERGGGAYVKCISFRKSALDDFSDTSNLQNLLIQLLHDTYFIDV